MRNMKNDKNYFLFCFGVFSNINEIKIGDSGAS